MRRILPLLGLAALVVGSLSACTVPANGLTGITVDDDGNLMAIVAWCDDNPPDGLSVYPSRANTTMARYAAPALTGHRAAVRLDAPADGWSVDHRPEFQPGTEYTIYGWTDDSTAHTAHVDFETEDADRLDPDTVLIQHYDPRSETTSDVFVSLAAFEDGAADYC